MLTGANPKCSNPFHWHSSRIKFSWDFWNYFWKLLTSKGTIQFYSSKAGVVSSSSTRHAHHPEGSAVPPTPGMCPESTKRTHLALPCWSSASPALEKTIQEALVNPSKPKFQSPRTIGRWYFGYFDTSQGQVWRFPLCCFLKSRSWASIDWALQ